MEPKQKPKPPMPNTRKSCHRADAGIEQSPEMTQKPDKEKPAAEPTEAFENQGEFPEMVDQGEGVRGPSRENERSV